MAPATGSSSSQPTRRNQLAAWSFVLSLVYPIGVTINSSAEFVGIATHSLNVYTTLGTVGSVLSTLGLPGMFAAIVTGHMALNQAKRYPPKQGRRMLAITGLVIGYLTLAALLTLAAGFIWLAIEAGPSGL